MKLVLGQFNDSFPPIMDGVANVVRNYSYWLAKKYGHCCVVTPFVPNYQDREAFDVIRYASIPVPGRYPYRAGIPAISRNVKSRLEEIPFDLVHAHSPFSAGQLAWKLARQRNIPLVASFHTKYYDDFLDAVKSRAIARSLTYYIVQFYNKADEVWTLNQETKNTLRSYGYQGRVEIVPPGIDLPSEDEDIRQDPYGNVRKASAPEEGPFEFLFVGQQVWHKNLRLMITALQQVKEWGIPFRMTMTGEGKALDEIKDLVGRLGMTGQFRFTGKICDRKALRDIYAGAHLFLFPSVYDTFGLVVCEAASVGCPSLVIRNSNAAGNIIDGFNGLLAENDVQSYALAIQNAVSDPERLAEIGRNAARTLARSWESAVDEVALRYGEILSNYKTRQNAQIM